MGQCTLFLSPQPLVLSLQLRDLCQQHLLLLDPNDNIHTTLHNTSLEALLKAQPELLN